MEFRYESHPFCAVPVTSVYPQHIIRQIQTFFTPWIFLIISQTGHIGLLPTNILVLRTSRRQIFAGSQQTAPLG
jgi:hypothetical protein